MKTKSNFWAEKVPYSTYISAQQVFKGKKINSANITNNPCMCSSCSSPPCGNCDGPCGNGDGD